MEKVIAVVVTHNRLTLLSECIDALRRQTRKPDAILVVNNDSIDDTEKWLLSQQDLVFITQKNIGSSGGFNTGINWAFENNYSWIWCMDDDGYPKEDALEKILRSDIETLSLRNCAVVNKEDKKSFVWKTGRYQNIDEVDTHILKGVAHPFNGTMIHRNIVERVGLPKPSLFLWGDETEYYYRITKKNKIPVYTITDSIHYHPAATFSYKKDWDYGKTWKMYFYVRNRLQIQESRFGTRMMAIFHYCFFLAALTVLILLYQKTDKSKKLGFLLWPAADAFNHDYTATPLTILSRLETRKNFSYKKIVNAYFKNLLTGLLSGFNIAGFRRAANL